ncbi:hypothetical protein Fcan01_22541 [Folsomia candida]|uniref:Uncharacterized protein n=1 Tax=Folsomia candida TaxID=158441 RepID=A0A226DE14_FOLCA|nr:hypothetical protein Fcan01_22541 [Folsomia candida]
MSSSSNNPSTSSATTTPPAKKTKLNINQTVLVSEETKTSSSSVDQLYVKRDDGTFEPLEQCSPIKTEVASSRFNWEPHVEVDDDEKWTPPAQNTRAGMVFNAVKTYLKWIGEDKDMKSSPEMKK